MPTFHYRALQSDGRISEGTLDAGSRPEAMRLLEQRALRPVKVAEGASKGGKKRTDSSATAAQGSAKGGFALRPAKVTSAELENFTRLLSSLLAAGVPLSRALVILCKEASTPIAGEKWKEIHGLVVDGMSLASAMAR